MKKKLGLIINPVAGIGGPAALKGSDGESVQAQALARGAIKKAGARTAQALEELLPLAGDFRVYAGSGEMGADLARAMGFSVEEIPLASLPEKPTTARDTETAARHMAGKGVDLILFAGGDGTARNVCAALDGTGEDKAASSTRVPVVGVPAGVKIHSAVYAATPQSAGKAACAYLEGKAGLREAEVMDINEDEYRAGRLQARLYGYLRVPALRGLMQNPKAASHHQDNDVSGLCHEMAERVASDPGACWVFGAGSTVSHVMRHLGLEGTLLGVDVIKNGQFLERDATEASLLEIASAHPCRLVITAIGGQGHIFGRGNQQLSPAVLRAMNIPGERLQVVAAASKIFSLPDQRLVVDTGDESLNQDLRGYLKVIVGYQETLVCQVV